MIINAALTNAADKDSVCHFFVNMYVIKIKWAKNINAEIIYYSKLDYQDFVLILLLRICIPIKPPTIPNIEFTIRLLVKMEIVYRMEKPLCLISSEILYNKFITSFQMGLAGKSLIIFSTSGKVEEISLVLVTNTIIISNVEPNKAAKTPVNKPKTTHLPAFKTSKFFVDL